MQFIIIARDHTDQEALNRRLAVRDQHLADSEKLHQENKALFGVAMLDENQNMNGSVYIMDFEDRTALDNWLKTEPYVKNNVWDNIEVIPGKVGASFLK